MVNKFSAIRQRFDKDGQGDVKVNSKPALRK
jgi:hypothetical protein